jgi:hypothetical protein
MQQQQRTAQMKSVRSRMVLVELLLRQAARQKCSTNAPHDLPCCAEAAAVAEHPREPQRQRNGHLTPRAVYLACFKRGREDASCVMSSPPLSEAIADGALAVLGWQAANEQQVVRQAHESRPVARSSC